MKCEYGICRCPIGQHFDQTESICLNNTLMNSPCMSNRTCNSFLGLSCQETKCQCQRSSLIEMYWNGTFCLEAGGSWAKCKKDYECKNSYKCLDKISRCSKEFFFSSFLRSGSACLNVNNIYLLTFFSLLSVNFF